MKRQATISSYFTIPKKVKHSTKEIETLSKKFQEKLGNLQKQRQEKNQKVNDIVDEKLTPLERQVVELKSKYPDYLLLIEVGYKFKFFGQDAKIASRLLHVAHFIDRHFYVASIPVYRLQVHVQKLVDAGYKVGIIRQTESAALKINKGQPFQRELDQLLTKGTHITSHKDGYLMCLSEEDSIIGMVTVQLSTGDIIYDSFQGIDELETRLLHLEPVEILLSTENQATENVVQHYKTRFSCRLEKLLLKHNEAFTFVTEFYTSTDNTDALSQVLNLPHIIIKSLAYLIEYLQEFNLSNILKLSTLFTNFVSANHMILNGNTLVNLEIFRNSTDSAERGSLFSIMNHTLTPFGKRLLKKWIGRPLIQPEKLTERTDAVEEIVRDQEGLIRLLKQLPDLEKGLTRIHYSKSTPIQVAQILNAFHKVALYKPCCQFNSVVLDTLFRSFPTVLQDVVKWKSLIYTDSDQLDKFFRQEDVWPGIPKERDKIKSIEQLLDDHLALLIQTTDIQDLCYVTVAGVDYQIQISNKQVHKTPLNWIKVSGTKINSRFHDPYIIDQLKERERHRELLKKELEIAYKDFMKSITMKYEELRYIVSCLSQLDCLFSLYKISQQVNYVKPTFGDCINVVEGRHPIIEQLVNGYVTNNYKLSETMVLTGPNMGGKSSFIRQVGLMSIMAQVGSSVPARSAQLPLFDGIYTRMGASDDMMKGSSTFMVELSETSEILQKATKDSLVIFDELGRGTSTHDGQAIAFAVLDHFIRLKSVTLFVTHYPLMETTTRHCYMDYITEDEEVVFLYKLVDGITTKSFGLNVAKLAGIPQPILERAKLKSLEFQREMEFKQQAKYILQTINTMFF